jgi:hypothetical protein
MLLCVTSMHDRTMGADVLYDPSPTGGNDVNCLKKNIRIKSFFLHLNANMYVQTFRLPVPRILWSRFVYW